MRRLFLIIKADFINLIKNPMWIFYATGFPICLILIMGYMMKNSFGSEITSFDYYTVSLMIYSILSSGMTSANAFMEERIKKPNMRIIYSPGSIKSIVISKIISTFIFCSIFHIIDISLIYIVFNVNLGSALLPILVLFEACELFSVTLGVMLCCIFKEESTSNQILSIVVNIIGILGGLLFSLDSFGETISKITYISPAKWIMEASFEMIYDNNFRMFIPATVIIVILTLIMIFVCNKTFKKEDCIC